MEKFYSKVIKWRKWIMAIFILLTILCMYLQNFVGVNYDLYDYLPQDVASTVALDTMQEEFEGGIPNGRVMIRDVTIPEALEYKKKMQEVPGVTEVTWLDDTVDIEIPQSMQDKEVVETYYKDGNALFSITIDDKYRIEAVDAIRSIIGEENSMDGSAVSTAISTVNTLKEVQVVAVIAVLFVFLVLIFTTKSWIEPIVVLIGLGVAIMINNGTNIIFGEISFVTNAAGSVLQLAVSLDYSVFLLHRFEECKKEEKDAKKAMLTALCKSTGSIASSGLTTVIGFLSLVLMRFLLGPDLGWALAKGVAISLITVFLFMPGLILACNKWMDKMAHRSFVPNFYGLGKLVQKAAIPMIFLFLVMIIPSYLASNSNFYYYGSSKIYGEGSTYGCDKEAIETVFGKGDTYVLMVPRGKNENEMHLSDRLHELPEVKDVISYVDMAGAEIPESFLSDEVLSLLKSDKYSRFVISVEAEYEGDETFALVENIRNLANKYYPGEYHLAGEGISTYDLKDTVVADMVKVNLLSIGAVFLVLLFMMKSVVVPVILVLCIEVAIWVNLTVPYFLGAPIYYIAYLIISSVQLGATVDYAILMTDRYRENRKMYEKREAVIQTVADVTVSILTSGSALAVVGMLLGQFSSNQMLAQLGIFVGRGAICSMIIVIFVLPSLLRVFDRWVIRENRKMEGQIE